MKTSTFDLRGSFESLDHLGVEKQLLRVPGVTQVSANAASDSVTVSFDEARTSETAIEEQIAACGFHCGGRLVPRHVCVIGSTTQSSVLPDATHPPDHRSDGVAARSVAPDRKPVTAEHDAMAHEMGHGDGKDMAAMARDMRNRFIVSLVFGLPIFALSPMGLDHPLLKPMFGLSLDLTLFLLASAAIL